MEFSYLNGKSPAECRAEQAVCRAKKHGYSIEDCQMKCRRGEYSERCCSGKPRASLTLLYSVHILRMRIGYSSVKCFNATSMTV
jgi:hypothetical protein